MKGVFITSLIIGVPVGFLFLTGDYKLASQYLGLSMMWLMFFGIAVGLGVLTDAAEDEGREKERRRAAAQKKLDNYDYLG